MDNIPNNVNIIFRNSTRDDPGLQNINKIIRLKKQNSNLNVETEKNINANNLNNYKTEEGKLFEDKFFGINQNCVYVMLNRLLYSDKCLYFYYFNMVLALMLLAISVVKVFILGNNEQGKLFF